ncbi:aspartyl/asparaginyl beta-hydroxylase domain-containing protein [Parafrankia sp. FMc6]|uniref:aspartyl/asparaginyl beta-hydroxylase domain-containing protein n=1 Tax=Parafrankia soli TaxID=2599596 RepID=UPI0034D48301
MRTRMLGRAALDESAVRRDLDLAGSFRYSDAYSDYLCGGPWRSCMLWAPGGDAGDGLVTNYDHDLPSGLTRYGDQLTYLAAVTERLFDLDHLNFARLAVISNSVIIPHRDLLELDEIPGSRRNAHRIHIPLKTDDQCFFAEDNLVFRMGFGEVWALDASREHSAASFSSRSRIHLVLDFTDVPDPASLVRLPADQGSDPPEHARPPLDDGERDALLALAEVIDRDNCRDVLAIVVKAHFRRDGGAGFVWTTMREIARRSGDPAVVGLVRQLHDHFLIERTA